jgi:pimeloyl-ACP methyl ester carboxylesterase
LELPGYGKTPLHNGPYDVEALTGWLQTVIERERPTHVVGHSMGGILALSLAGQDETEFTSVGVIGLPIYTSPAEGRSHLGQRGRAIRSVLRWHRLTHMGCIVASRTHPVWQGWARRRWPHQPRGVLRAVVDHRRGAHGDALERIIWANHVETLAAASQVPVAALHGEGDRAAPLPPVRVAAEQWGWDLTVERDANHQVLLERPRFTAQWIRTSVLAAAATATPSTEGLQAAGG